MFNEERLYNEKEKLMEFARNSNLITIEAHNDPPDEYTVFYNVRGLSISSNNQVIVQEGFAAQIKLPAEYPAQPPEFKVAAPIFHPNIATVGQRQSVMTTIVSGLEDARNNVQRRQFMRDFKRNIESQREWADVCLYELSTDRNWRPEIWLKDIVLTVGEMIQYKQYMLGEDWNVAADALVHKFKDSFPIDPRKLIDVTQMTSDNADTRKGAVLRIGGTYDAKLTGTDARSEEGQT